MAEFVMPTLGADMEAGTLVRWCKQPGDVVHRGDIIAEVETDKGVIDVDVFVNGIVEKTLVDVGQKVPVGTVLAIIRDNSDQPSPALKAAPAAQMPDTTRTVSGVPPPAQISSIAASPVHGRPSMRQAISPSARRLARELGVDTECLTGTGRHGAITRDDIERAAAATSKTVAVAPHGTIPDASARDRAVRMQQVIAARMTRSKREIPHFYLSHTIDMQPAMTWLEDQNSRRPIADRLLYGALLLKAVAIALHEFPELNAIWDGDQAIHQQDIHVGVVVSMREGGLVVPAIRDTDKKNISELMAAFRDVVNRARSGRLRSSELADATISVTSLGDQGVEAVFGVIFPPQVALIGFGKLVERPWALNGGLFVHQTITATLSADHRVTDGHKGGRFLSTIARLLQEPEKL
jgi:pyruvate dehydrogenase E2 component (dihydrolipoamide acetyltransferase)